MLLSLHATYQSLSRQHLQELNEHAAIPQIHVEVCDAAGDTGQVGVHPFGKGLLLHCFSLIYREKKGIC